jgi:hypothetical protein
VAYALALPAIVIPAAALLALAAALAHRQRLARAETAWLIPAGELTYPDPPEVLGCGSQGVVVRAVHRGTSVAVKRFRARPWTGSADGSSSGKWVGGGDGAGEKSDGSMTRSSKGTAGRSVDLEGGGRFGQAFSLQSPELGFGDQVRHRGE